MASTTAPFNSPEFPGRNRVTPVAAATVIHPGNLVSVLTTTGMSTGAGDVATTRCIGRSVDYVDNAAGAAGDVYVNTVRGRFSFNNSAVAAITPGDVGALCYCETPDTVRKTGGTNSIIAGRVAGFDGVRVIVDLDAL